MLLSAVSFLVVAQSSSEIPEVLMNNPVYQKRGEISYRVFRNLIVSVCVSSLSYGDYKSNASSNYSVSIGVMYSTSQFARRPA